MKKKKKIQTRSKGDGPWGWYHHSVLEVYGPKIGAGALGLYIAYTNHAYGKKQTVWPSQLTLMELLDITPKTLRRYNKKLEKHKMIWIESRIGKVNRIHLLRLKHPEEGSVIMTQVGGGSNLPRGRVKMTQGVGHDDPRIRIKNKNKEEYNSAASSGTRLKKGVLKGCKTSDRDSFDKFTDILITLLRSKKKIMKRPNKNVWKKQFILLHRDGVDRKKIRSILKWYKEHIGEPFVPDIRTAGGFRSKFDKLVAAKERYKKDEASGEVDFKARRKHKKNKKRRMD